MALRSTLFRLACFLGHRESLQRQLTYLDYRDSERTARVLMALEDVATKLASARLDAEGGRPRLMLWKDEQRAVGGLMLDEGATTGVLGFEDFFDQYEETFRGWLGDFAKDLATEGIERAERLAQLYGSLERLVSLLDTEGRRSSACVRRTDQLDRDHARTLCASKGRGLSANPGRHAGAPPG